MRILHVIDSTATEFGGPPRCALDLARLTAELGHPTTIVTPDPRDAPAAWVENAGNSGPKDAHLPAVAGLSGPRGSLGRLGAEMIPKTDRLLRSADVIHFHGVFNTMFVQIAGMARRLKVAYFVTAHGMLDDWSMAQKSLKKRLYLALGGRGYLEQAQFVHCTAEGEVRQSRKWFPKGEVVTVPYVIDMAAYRDLPGPDMARERWQFLQDQERLNVLFLSRLHYKKGPDVLIDAIGLAHAQGAKVRLILAGDGDKPYVEQLRAVVASRGIESITHFVGQVSGPPKFSLYQACDIFALPTSQENFGLVYTESLASGTPVVTTRGTDIHPELERSGSVVICERTPEAFADAIATLARDRARVASMGAGSQAWVLETYDERRTLQRFIEMYQRCADATARR
jgi:glycosyltransferase involved in cell wall biosynthesis